MNFEKLNTVLLTVLIAIGSGIYIEVKSTSSSKQLSEIRQKLITVKAQLTDIESKAPHGNPPTLEEIDGRIKHWSMHYGSHFSNR